MSATPINTVRARTPSCRRSARAAPCGGPEPPLLTDLDVAEVERVELRILMESADVTAHRDVPVRGAHVGVGHLAGHELESSPVQLATTLRIDHPLRLRDGPRGFRVLPVHVV